MAHMCACTVPYLCTCMIMPALIYEPVLILAYKRVYINILVESVQAIESKSLLHRQQTAMEIYSYVKCFATVPLMKY